MLKLTDYADSIKLFEKYKYPEILLSQESKKKYLSEILEYFIDKKDIPDVVEEKIKHLKAILTTRLPEPIKTQILEKINSILFTESVELGIEDLEKILSVSQLYNYTGKHKDIFSVWKGDITRLSVDAIVNAANEKMLGCFRPFHACIDNVIHNGAGPQVRQDCSTIMKLQGKDEETGCAKITRAYNLPSRFILHTVGPIVDGVLQDYQKQLLASSYTSCLELAASTKQIQSIAFCCISTGVFGFPQEQAAHIAVKTISSYLDTNQGNFNKIILNVFLEEDFEIYKRIFT